MKQTAKHLKRLCVLAAVILSGVLTATAADFMVDNICYNVIADGQVEVTRLDSGKYTGEVYIPATVSHDGTSFQVTCIGKQAFSDCTELTLVDIPEGITEIGDNAFYNCTQLSFLDFPNSLVKVGLFAFYRCYGITSFYIPRNVAELNGSAFCGCDNTTSYMCSGMNAHFKAVDGVLYTKDMTRLVTYPAASPTTVFNIPEGVTVIDNTAFYHSENLVELNFPAGITWIGYSALRGCTGLTSLTLPDAITHMGPSCMSYCDNLASLHLPASLDTIANSVIAELPSLTQVTIPRNVKYIEDFAAVGSTGLKTITFEEGSCLQAIGLRAFEDCTSLESFDMPNSVTDIDGQIFGNCTSLKTVHLSENLTDMGGATFWGCTSLTECYIPSSVPIVPNASFGNCTSLKNIIIGEKDATQRSTLMVNSCISSIPALARLELGANVDSLVSSAINAPNIKVFISWSLTPPRCNGYWSPFGMYVQNDNCVLYVPRAALETYRTTIHWQDFKTIVPIEDAGDVNGDGIINITDVTALIDLLLADEIQTPAALADANLDGELNITDVTALIDRLLAAQ